MAIQLSTVLSAAGKAQEIISTGADYGAKAAKVGEDTSGVLLDKKVLAGEKHEKNLTKSKSFFKGLKHLFQAIGKAVTLDIAGAIEAGKEAKEAFAGMKKSASQTVGENTTPAFNTATNR